VADTKREKYWADRLRKAYEGKKLVGIAWKSGKKFNNNLYGVPIDIWNDIFSLKDIVFINLQYGEVEDELQEARDRHSVEIVNLMGLDVMNDFDEVAALVTQLDAVVAIAATPLFFAGAVGARAFGVGPRCFPWLLGTNRMPLLPRIKWHLWDDMTSRDLVMQQVAIALSREFEQSKERG
jgi:hypothetical protein